MRRTILVSFLAIAGARVSTNATMLAPSPVPRPRVDADQESIYRTAEQVKGKYEELPLLNSTGESSWTNEEKMFSSMRKKAGSIGANGIILDAIGEPSAGMKIAGSVFGTGAQRKGRAVAIYVLPDSTK